MKTLCPFYKVEKAHAPNIRRNLNQLRLIDVKGYGIIVAL